MVFNSPGGGHILSHTNFRTKAILRNQACAWFKNQGCTRLFATLLQLSDNLVTALSLHCDNLVFETVTILSQPCYNLVQRCYNFVQPCFCMGTSTCNDRNNCFKIQNAMLNDPLYFTSQSVYCCTQGWQCSQFKFKPLLYVN